MIRKWDWYFIFAWALMLAYCVSFWAAVVITVVKHR